MAYLVLYKGRDPICDTGGLCVLTWCDEDAFQLGSVLGSHLLPPHSLLSCAPEGTVAWSSFIEPRGGWVGSDDNSVYSQAREMVDRVA